MSQNIVPWAKPELGKLELNLIRDVFKNDMFTMGKNVNLLEKKMSRYCDSKYAIAISNGTVALDIALKTINILPGDEVIVPAISYFSTASAVSYQKAIPVFVDIELNTYNIDASKIERCISKKTKAIIYIDYGGNPSNHEEIFRIARKYNLIVINDAAQSLGAKKNGKNLGAFGDISTMSFHMAKMISTIEGGMIFTNNKNYYNKIITLRNIGEPKGKKYIHDEIGTNARMTEINAAIGIAQFTKLKKFVKNRINVAKIYDSLITENKLNVNIVKKINRKSSNAYFFYPILIKDRDKIASILKNKFFIDTRIAYPMPIYEQPVYKKNKKLFKKIDCPNAVKFSKEVLNLPIFPSMTKKEIEYVVFSLSKII